MNDQFELEIEIEDEEPNPERIQAIQNACQIFADVCRCNPETAPQSDDDMSEIIEGILRRNGDLADSLAYTIEWRAIREKRREAARSETEREARDEDRRQTIADYKLPSNRAETIRELRAGHTAPSPAGFVPTREYTDAEMSAMSSDDYRRLVLGHLSIADRQGRGDGRTVREERNSLILADKVLNRAGISKTRSIKVSPEELAAREQRARAIAADRAERRKLEQEWRNKK
jgi:hypothetical protein